MTYNLQLSNINNIAEEFIKIIGNKKIFAFYGEMGAGKTTFISAVCKQLGVNEPVTSPTFAIINEYHTNKGGIIYHLDCYRLNSIQEAKNIGIEEYFDSGNLCFIEWAENIEEILPFDTLKILINKTNDGEREVVVKNTLL